MRDELPRDIRDQLDAVISGYGPAAEELARHHITQAAAVMISRLRSEAAAAAEEAATAPA